ncbi:MAG: L,D-transpeptidase [Gammaproteobacteria bacterium]|nr:MAG: L,D-transpeptidase [Gammaproteobacteria bacterium]
MNQDKHIEVNISLQTLTLFAGNEVIKQYTISTAKNGPGEQMDSECTPRGKHLIHEKIGAGCEANTVFVGREATGELYHPELREQFPDRDWILTRILWLSGCEAGRNKGGNVDSYDRYIYIHGGPDDIAMGVPGSRGCVRMQNDDMIELFDLVETETAVNIVEE